LAAIHKDNESGFSMSDPTRINTTEHLTKALALVSVREPFAAMQWHWVYRECADGWFVRAQFSRNDASTGALGIGRSREELVYVGSTVSAFVKTLFLLVKVTMEHEVMEAFHFDGERIFDPHNDVFDLFDMAVATKRRAQ
jgi:hypothetical protein